MANLENRPEPDFDELSVEEMDGVAGGGGTLADNQNCPCTNGSNCGAVATEPTFSS